MNGLLLAALLCPTRVLADKPEPLNDLKMRHELEKVETKNLKNATAGAHGEASRGLRLIRSLITSGQANLESARVEIESILRDPEKLRRHVSHEQGDPVGILEAQHEALLMAGQLLTAKSDQFITKLSSVPLGIPEEDPIKLLALRAAYKARDRGSDLHRAQADAAAAQKRLGIGELWPGVVEALAALGNCVTEIRAAIKQTDAAAQMLAAERGRRPDVFVPAREELAARARALEADARDLDREAELLKANLILLKADQHITGRAVKH